MEQIAPNARDHLVQSCAAFGVHGYERPIAARRSGVARHDVTTGAGVRGEIDLLVRSRSERVTPGPPLCRILSPRDIDHIDQRVHADISGSSSMGLERNSAQPEFDAAAVYACNGTP